MANERNTENLVRAIFQKLGYYSNEKIIVEEQSSKIAEVTKLLKGASKTGGKGSGFPEFIISTPETPDFLIVVECKADPRKHQSKKNDKPKNYAVDGVLHYAKKLSKSYNVIAVAASGETKSSLKVSNFIFTKQSNEYKKLVNKDKAEISSIVSLEDYIKHGTYDESVASKRHSDLMEFSKDLHEFMRSYAKLTEAEKPLLVSGTLLALRNAGFSKSFDVYTPEDLQKEWIKVIEVELEKAKMPHSKKQIMVQPYTSISTHPELGKPTQSHPKGVLYELINDLNEKVWPFISVYNNFDVVGQFYGEFLKYTGGDKKALGIVLTPKHITELFSLLANTQKDSRVLDICAGTGGFLISAMHQMIKNTSTEDEISMIKSEGLIGVEQQPNMFALAASNMILRGDGKANLYQGDCFDAELVKKIKDHKCNIGFLNPPYAQAGSDFHELSFVKHLLDCLEPNGIGIAIVPISCATTPHPLKEELLSHHTLDAVMSMPTELFYPVGVVTCIMVFKAHTPHVKTNLKTWFGYWKDDGFIKSKKKGRIDNMKSWGEICSQWVSSYRNRDDIPGECVKQQVGSKDEWVSEAYLETNYDRLSQDDFEQVVLDYSIFKIKNGISNEIAS